MRTYLRLKHRQSRHLPAEFRDEELRYPEELVAAFLQHYSRPGDVVLDPFAGYGTTLLVAEQLGRVPVGVEHDARRVRYVRTRLQDAHAIRQGDARGLLGMGLPLSDFCMTSPPFMAHSDGESALAGGDTPPGGELYAAYLRDMQHIFAQVRRLLKPGARAVLEVSNLKGPRGVTTLAWDIGRAVGAELRFEGEVIICWDSYDYGYDHSYCLVFSRHI